MEVTNIYDKLFPYTQVDYITKSQHVANIHNKLNQQAIYKSVPNEVTLKQAENTYEGSAEEPPFFKCPKCNGKLILRTATKGTNAGKQFYGCSNYPKCKYIRNIM